jgi:hypothetical protein
MRRRSTLLVIPLRSPSIITMLSDERSSKGVVLSREGVAVKSFHEVGNLLREQTIRFRDRRHIRIMNQTEWYRSKS